MLSRDEILAADDSGSERVKVNEWGGDVVVRCMSAYERDQWEDEVFQDKRKDNARARLLVRCLHDEQGNKLFTADDIESLGKKSGKVLARLFTVAMRVCGLRQQDIDELSGN